MLRRFASIVVVVCAAVSGCEQDCDAIEPAYAGEATDEVWRSLVGARADASDGGDAATITAPVDGEVDASTPAIAWDSPLRVASAATPTTPPPFDWRKHMAHRRRQPGVLDALSSLIVPSARAHLAPVTSDVYFVEVDVPGRTCPVALLTTETTATFSDDDRATIDAGGGERTVRIMSAFVTQNRITEGPYTASPVTFSIE